MAPVIRNARDLRNNWGVAGAETQADDVNGNGSNGAAGLNYLNCRWSRYDMVNSGIGGGGNNGTGQAQANTQAAMVALGMFDPNLKSCGIVSGTLGSPIFSAQQAGLLTAAARTSPNNGKIFTIMEGINEIGNASVGGHHAFDNLTSIDSAGAIDGCGNPTIMKAAFDWSVAINAFRNNNAAAFSGTKVISCTILDDGSNGGTFSASGRQGDYPAASPNGINVSGQVDYGAFHWYWNPQFGGSAPSNTDGISAGMNFTGAYQGFKNGFSGGANNLALCVTEAGGNESDLFEIDGVSCGWGATCMMLDFFWLGGQLFMHYNLAGNGNLGQQGVDGGFGLFGTRNSGGYTPTLAPNNPRPRAMAYRNFSTLMSLGNTYNNVANTSDTNTITPAYTGAGLTVTGMTGAGTGGSFMVCPKSDNSTMIPVWRQPAGLVRASSPPAATSTVPAVNNVTVNFGSIQTYRVWDPYGGIGGSTTAFSGTPTLVAGLAGTGTSVILPLYVCLFIELLPNQVVGVPATPATPTLGATTATTQVINWVAVTSGGAAVSNYTAQFSLNNATWTTPAGAQNLGTASTYTFVGLSPATPYFFRVQATNAIGGPISSASISATTAGSSGGTTPVLVQSAAFRSDAPTATASITLGLSNQPLSTNTIWVTFGGFAGSGTNSNAITAPTGSTVVSGPNYDGGSEVTWAWQVPYTSTNQWTFSNFDFANNATWYIFEVSGYSTFDTTHGIVPSETATSVGLTLAAPTFTNVLRLTALTLQFAATIGAGSAGVSVLRSDPLSVQFHQGVLVSEQPTTASPASVGLTGGTAGDTSAYINIQFYGGALPNQITGLTTSGITSAGVNLAWTGQTGITSYTVQQSSTSATAGFATIATVPSTASNFTVTGLVANTAYWFKVAANSNAGQGAFSTVVAITTLVTSTLFVVQTAQGSDLNAVSSVTATMANPTKIGNFLITYVSMAGLAQNLALTNPAGTTLISNASNSDSYAIMWTQTITAAATSYTWTGYADLASISVVEVQGVTSVFGSGSGTAIFTDNVSTSIPVVIPGTTPNLSILAVGMDIGPDSWGTMPANTTLLQQILSVPPNTIAYHQASLFQLSSVGTSGTRVFPFTSSFAQAAGPLYSEIELSGAVVAPTPPGPTTLSFVSATTSSITLSRSTATGTVSAYTLVISATANMLNGQAYDMPLTNLTITTRPTAVGGGPLVAGTTYFFTVQAFNGPSTGGPVSAVFSATTLLGSTLRPVLIGGKPLLIGGKIVVA